MIETIQLKSILQGTFDKAVTITKQKAFRQLNSLKSSKFVSEFADSIYEEFFNHPSNNLNVIKVDNKGEKYAGEWLLDITITKDVYGFKEEILVAVESESDTSKKAFDEDFAKLLHTKSQNYIYLNGLDQKTELGRDDYINDRISYAQRHLKNKDIKNFYLGFWASPRKIGDVKSIWDELPNGKFNHLNNTVLYKLIDQNFEEI
jgi:hypothetical protein